jgi:hypothetical protein
MPSKKHEACSDFTIRSIREQFPIIWNVSGVLENAAAGDVNFESQRPRRLQAGPQAADRCTCFSGRKPAYSRRDCCFQQYLHQIIMLAVVRTGPVRHPPLRPRNVVATIGIVFMRHKSEIRSIETNLPLRHPAYPCNIYGRPPPCKSFLDRCDIKSRLLPSIRPVHAVRRTAGPDEIRGSTPNHATELFRSLLHTGSADPGPTCPVITSSSALANRR